jgi:hypothetical protein
MWSLRDERDYRRVMKSIYKSCFESSPSDPLKKSLRDRERAVRTGADTYALIGYVDLVGVTDVELIEWAKGKKADMGRAPLGMVGVGFTYLLHWHWNPSGLITYVQRVRVRPLAKRASAQVLELAG